MCRVSSHGATRLWITAADGRPILAVRRCGFLRLGWGIALLFLFALPAAAQYPGQIKNDDRNAADLRAVGVLEWTGGEDHPKAGRLIPICIYDGQDLEDASVYLAQPAPLAVESEVEYQLFENGKPVGLFDIDSAGQQQGFWVGFGKWKPLPKPRPAPAQAARIDEDDAQSDVPILHRKHHSGDSGSGSGSGNGTGADSNASPPDPDRPTLHKGGDASAGDSSGGSGSSSGGSGDTASDSSAPAPDPNRPTLHHGDDTSSSAGASPSDSGRPKLKKKNGDDEAYVEDVATVTDPGRPHLFYGKAAGYSSPVLPSLVGLPIDMHQEVAVSDAKSRPEHLWSYTWANPGDEDKMKAAMEDLARTALGLNPPPAPRSKPAPKSSSAHKPSTPASPPPPAPLLVDQFRVFELAYGSGATMVLSAHTLGTGAQEKFVTLIAQPDLYGGVAVLVKNVSDAAHLDSTPRMKLIDAVDALADNRGELLFELRGATQRQFALYRVLRGDATRIFLTAATAIGATAAAAPSGE